MNLNFLLLLVVSIKQNAAVQRAIPCYHWHGCDSPDASVLTCHSFWMTPSTVSTAEQISSTGSPWLDTWRFSRVIYAVAVGVAFQQNHTTYQISNSPQCTAVRSRNAGAMPQQ